MRTGAIFGPIHDVSRHAIHAAEILEATIDTVKELQHRQIAVHGRLYDNLGDTYKDQARDYTQFQISMLKNLRLRSDSNQERLKSEIDLVRETDILRLRSFPELLTHMWQAFNNLARQDNNVMKSIALLGMIFLPPTFISVCTRTREPRFDVVLLTSQ